MNRPASLLLGLAAVLVPHARDAQRPDAAPRKTVAVLYFDNHTGRSDYDPLGKGLASMMISDLSSVEQIQLGERERLQDLV
jgi:TolB-like protein